ncbi:tetraspanin-3-like isoform X2 [Hyla sarda]|uniref:tetraspanin-3-like isoform X2 n=1 Tax=Hyla sarda TaxID=327740 RepID=UPI0024C2770A|nr:tetraspanin-3-like isoform X2 [Hyla sarda]
MGRFVESSARLCIGLLSFLFWVSAAALIFAGYFLIILYKRYKPFFVGFHILLPSGFAVTGAVLLVLNGLLGFKISNRGSRCQQGTTSGVVLAYVCIHWLDYELTPMQNAFQQYNGSGMFVNKIQKELHCCGLQNYSDWEMTPWYKYSGNNTVPTSCCNMAYSACTGNITESNELYSEGCFVKLQYRLSFYLFWLVWSGIAITGTQVLAVISDGVLMTRNPFQDFRILDSGTFA